MGNDHDDQPSASGSGSAEEASSSAGPSHQPAYMTVGSGTVSENAARLAAMLESDSGYGGSIMDGSARSWDLGMTEDRPTPGGTPILNGSTGSMGDDGRRVLASHIHQLYYNQNRTALGRAITRTVDTLKRLHEMNSAWPAHYPSVQRSEQRPMSPTKLDKRPTFHSTQSAFTGHSTDTDATMKRPHGLKRADTTMSHAMGDESADVAQEKAVQEPRLVSSQLAEDFSVLKLDLKLVDARQADIVHSLDKEALAKFLNEQISKSIKHLLSLRDRIEDTSSKVLVTGDLNAGKSTFCNALLRRTVLPVDQQPCTSIFCEVLDFNENGGIEEVHAIPIGQTYNRNDESTYQVFAIKELENIVIDNDHFSQCKIYIKDIRSVDESLLNNGVVDIALIDAPGLNSDSLKTTAIFARQEEIDVVVFVVSAANYFTLSAKEFIFNAAREKAYMFMVVNGFDNIRDKKRCQEQILKQVYQLSPATFKESSELVHFVSSNAIPVMPPGGDPSGGSSGGGGGGGSYSEGSSGFPGDDNDDDDDDGRKHGDKGSPPDKGKGKAKEKQDFSDLEASLRRFVLEKRARSKLAPAKTYLVNLLADLDNLASVNVRIAGEELNRISNEKHSVDEAYDESSKARNIIGEQTGQVFDETATEVYDYTRGSLTGTIAKFADQDFGVHYDGLFSAVQFAQEVKMAMIHEIANTVELCEEHARSQTTKGVSSIRALGLKSLGDAYSDLTFRPDKMFRRRKDALVRQVELEVEITDFFDLAGLWERQEKVAGTSMAVTVAGVVGTRMIGGVGMGWVDGAVGAARVMGSQNLRRLIIPGILAATLLGLSYALASIPTSVPRRLSARLALVLDKLDYTHANSKRISDEVRRALRIPAEDLRETLRGRVSELENDLKEKGRLMEESENAKKYFSSLMRETAEVRAGVERVDLEGPAPGVAAAIDP